MQFEHHQRVLFIGDSVTDSERTGSAAPYGNGYVNILRNFLLGRYPAHNLTILNRGVGGNTVRHLAARWQTDVLAEYPNWVSILIGMYDVWRHFSGDPKDAVPIEEFRTTLRGLVQETQNKIGAKILLLTPFMIEPDKQNPIRQLMVLYARAVELIAADFKAPLVNLQDAFDLKLPVTAPQYWGTDAFHPGGAGHALITQAVMKVIGYEI